MVDGYWKVHVEFPFVVPPVFATSLETGVRVEMAAALCGESMTTGTGEQVGPVTCLSDLPTSPIPLLTARGGSAIQFEAEGWNISWESTCGVILDQTPPVFATIDGCLAYNPDGVKATIAIPDGERLARVKIYGNRSDNDNFTKVFYLRIKAS